MNPISYLWGKMWRFSVGNRGRVVLYVVFFIVANLIYFLEPLVIARILDIIQLQGLTWASFPELVQNLLYLPAITVGFWTFHGIARVVEQKNAFMVKANFKQFLVDTVLAYPLDWHNNHHSGDTIDKVEKGSTALYRFSTDTFQIISAIVPLVSSYIALSYFNIHSAYIVFVCIALTVVVILKFDKVLVRQYEELNQADNIISAKVFDVISNITTVVILRIQDLVAKAINHKLLLPLKLYTKNIQINEIKWFLVSFFSVMMTTGVLGTYLYSNLRAGQMIMLGTLSALYGYVGRITDLFFRFAYMYGDILQQKAAVLNAELLLKDRGNLSKTKKVKAITAWTHLQLKDIQFAYDTDNDRRLHLDHVSMTIKHGARIALIGASGSGKTTFLKVLRELYPLQKGGVMIDGKQQKGGLQAISNQIALIPQDPEIFSTSIRENITVGIEYDESLVQQFMDMACFSDVVQRLPHGLESQIFEKGVNLSGGERQRLALTRGLLASRDKSILLLDESTSSVDAKNELAIYEHIFKEFSDKTIIASIHRLHLLSNFDEIYFFKQGKIIATGTLADLLKNSAEFAELWEKYHEAHKS